MSLETNLKNVFLRIGTQFKTVAGYIGDVSSLTTSSKSSVVSAINELKSSVDAAAQSGGAAIDDTQATTNTVYSSSKSQGLFDSKVPTSRRVNGHTLDSDVTLGWGDFSGLIPSSALPAVALGTVQVVDSQAAMLALTAQAGDIARRTDTGETFMLNNDGNPSVLADWINISTDAAVNSVAGKVGDVTLVVADVSGAVASTDVGDTSTDFVAAFESALQ